MTQSTTWFEERQTGNPSSTYEWCWLVGVLVHLGSGPPACCGLVGWLEFRPAALLRWLPLFCCLVFCLALSTLVFVLCWFGLASFSGG